MAENNAPNLLLVALEYPPVLGGGGSYVDSLVDDIQASDPDINISVLTSGEFDQDTHDEKRPSIQLFRRASARAALLNTVLSADFINDFRTSVAEVNPDIIHAHHSIPIIALKSAMLHGDIPSFYTQHRTPELPGQPLKLDGKGIMGELAASLPGSGRWIAPSEFFKSRLVRSGVTEDDISVIWPSADYDRFMPKDAEQAKIDAQTFMNFDSEKKLVVVPVVPRPRKDVPFALEALRGTPTNVLVTGLVDNSPEDQALRSAYPDVALIHHDRLSDDQVATVFNAADAIIVPSTHEGFGIAGLEAVSTGSPTFLRNAPGLNEIAAQLPFIPQFQSPEELRDLVMNAQPLTLSQRRSQHQVVKKAFSAKQRGDAHVALYHHAHNQHTRATERES